MGRRKLLASKNSPEKELFEPDRPRRGRSRSVGRDAKVSNVNKTEGEDAMGKRQQFDDSKVNKSKKTPERKLNSTAKGDKATFSEDDQVIDMEVQNGDFPSDEEGRRDSEGTESSMDEGDKNDPSQEQNDGQGELDESQDHNKSQLETSENSEESEHSSRRSRPKKRRRKHRHRGRHARYSTDSETSSTSRSRSRSRSRARKLKKEKRQLKEQVQTLQAMVQSLQEVIVKSGMLENKAAGVRGGKQNVNLTPSETTIYHDLINQASATQNIDPEVSFNFNRQNRQSSSSDKIDTSDDLINVDCDQFITDCQEMARNKRDDAVEVNPYEVGENKTKEADQGKIPLTDTPGRGRVHDFLGINREPQQVNHVFLANIDDEYMSIGRHIDAALQEKIVNFEYIDFGKIIPRDKITKLEDQRMELVVKGGQTYFAPVSEREISSITNFSRWEQAFRIFSNVLTKVYPAKASELIQYNHTIYTAALTFAWDNVYQYDKEFRMHVSKFPQRSWAIILQQAWSMCLKDRVKINMEDNHSPGGHQKPTKIREPCKRYNKGKCTYGAGCKFEHRCAIKKCQKFGHRAHICRLRSKDETSSDQHK